MVHLSSLSAISEDDEVILRGSSSGIVDIFINKVLRNSVDMSSVLSVPLPSQTYIGSIDGMPNTSAIISTEELIMWDFPLSYADIQLA